METETSSTRTREVDVEARRLVGSGDEKEESRQQVPKDNVCFIHSARLLEAVDANPRYTGRVSPSPSTDQRHISCHL